MAPHLDEESISGFVKGLLLEPQREQVRAHAEDCPTCRSVIAAVKRDDPEGTVVDDGVASGSGIGTAPTKPQQVIPPEALLGRQVGEYVVEEILGTGGMGIVYKARHPLIGKTVAIKVLRPEYAADPAHMKNLLAEARAASQVSHRAIVDIFAFGALPDGRQYMVMEYLVGEPLNRIIKQTAPLPPHEQLAYVDAIAAALEAAHDAHIVHRDLKPSNLFIQRDRDGSVHVKLLDFGLARAAVNDGHTASGSLLGTPAYMSPEQVRGEPVDERTDLYALGVIAYELATKQRPFTSDNMFKLINAHLDEKPTPPSKVHAAVPKDIEALILRLLAKRRDARFETTAELRHEVRKLKQRYPATSDSRLHLGPVVPLAAPRLTARFPWGAVLASCLFAALAIGSALAWRHTRQPAPAGQVGR